MKLDQFLKARFKITLLISSISTLILAAFSGSIYYFYKEQILYEISDELKSLAFEVSKAVENPVVDFSIVKNVNIPDDTYLCVYNHEAKMVFYKNKLCDIDRFFQGFTIKGYDVLFGSSIKKNGTLYHVYVGKNLSKILANLEKLKLILIYATFVISTFILVFSFRFTRSQNASYSYFNKSISYKTERFQKY